MPGGQHLGDEGAAPSLYVSSAALPAPATQVRFAIPVGPKCKVTGSPRPAPRVCPGSRPQSATTILSPCQGRCCSTSHGPLQEGGASHQRALGRATNAPFRRGADSGPAGAGKPHAKSSCHHRVRSGGQGSGRDGGEEGSPGKPGLGRRKAGHEWPQAKNIRARDHRVSVSCSGPGLLSSSNVSSTTCHRQLSSGNSLSTRLTRK